MKTRQKFKIINGERYTRAKRHIELSAGNVVRNARELLELTQTALARKSGIPQSHISAIEHNRMPVGRKRAEMLAKALYLPPSMILFSEGKPRKGADDILMLKPPDRRKLTRLLRNILRNARSLKNRTSAEKSKETTLDLINQAHKALDILSCDRAERIHATSSKRLH